MTPTLQDEFVRAAGEIAESLSFNRSVGQIYGLLYLNGEPLALGRIADRIGMSKGNASVNLRVLEGWGAVRPVSVAGSRQDHYEANRDLKAIVQQRLQEGLSRRLDAAERHLDRLLVDGKSPADPEARKRLQELRALVTKGRRALRLLPQALKLFF